MAIPQSMLARRRRDSVVRHRMPRMTGVVDLEHRKLGADLGQEG